MTKKDFSNSLEASRRVCEVLTNVTSGLDFKRLSTRLLFESLYLHRSLEHFQSMFLLIEREQYNSALALRRVLYETYLRGLWVSRCASDEVIIAARKDNFTIPDKLLKRDKLEAQLTKSKIGGWQEEGKFYRRGCGFVHGGLYETAMYAIPTHPAVSKHMFTTLHRQLRLSTLRLLHVFPEFHSNLMRAVVEGKPYGTSGIDEVTLRTERLKALAAEYQAALKHLKAIETGD